MTFAIHRHKWTKREKRQNRFSWAFMAPILIYTTVLGMVPIFAAVVLSFTDYNGFTKLHFIGLRNYQDFFTGFFKAGGNGRIVLNTIGVSAVIMLLGMVISFLLALVLKRIAGKNAYRTIYYIPCIISTAVMAQIMSAFLNPSTGLINSVMQSMGIAPTVWQSSTFWMFFWIVFLCIWQGLGGSIIFFLAGLMSVPEELYEAAEMDGAGRVAKMLHVTIPCMKPMLSYILITSCIGIFNIFVPVQLISNGAPKGGTMVLYLKIYNDAYQNFELGASSAVSVLVLIFVMAITVLNMKVTKLKLD